MDTLMKNLYTTIRCFPSIKRGTQAKLQASRKVFSTEKSETKQKTTGSPPVSHKLIVSLQKNKTVKQ